MALPRLLLIPVLVALAGDAPAMGGSLDDRASATVPLGDPVYEELDRLDALGFLPGEVLGHRPLARAEIARIISTASKRPEAVHAPARDVLIRLRNQYPMRKEEEPQGIQEARMAVTITDAEPAPIPRENGVGAIEGMAYPLPAYREGSLFDNGATFWLQTHHAHNLSRSVVIGARTDLRWLTRSADPAGGPAAETPGDPDGNAHAGFKALYGRVTRGPVVLGLGRDAVAWGPLPRGGFQLSSNARPLDLFYVSHESPYRLPWIFRHMGPHRAILLVSGLGNDRTYANSFLVGMRASFRPHPRLETGFTETLILGGEGAPRPTALQVIRQMFPIGGVSPDFDYSDHRFGFDMRLQLWPRRILLYQELCFEDAREGYWTDVTSSRTGFYAPAWGPEGCLEARLEHVRLPAILYRHGRWITGYTLDDRIIGEELGPDAQAFRAGVKWNLTEGDHLKVDLDYETRDADLWAQVPRPSPPADPGRSGDIFRARDNPTERRYRAAASGEWGLGGGWTCQPRLAVERAHNYRFETDSDRTDFLAELGLRLGFGLEPRR